MEVHPPLVIHDDHVELLFLPLQKHRLGPHAFPAGNVAVGLLRSVGCRVIDHLVVIDSQLLEFILNLLIRSHRHRRHSFTVNRLHLL